MQNKKADTEGARPYCGRLEAVMIKERKANSVAIGSLSDGKKVKVYVFNGNNYLQRNCLVRFKLKKPGYCNFVSLRIPDGFQGLPNDAYALVGLWKGYMAWEGELPRLDEINRYYDPGDATCLIFLARKKGSDGLDRFAITPYNSYRFEGDSLTDCLKNVDPSRSARVVIVPDDLHGEHLDDAVREIRDAGLIPFVMEPLHLR